MIYEIAITPHAVAELGADIANGGVADKELASYLFPRGEGGNVQVSKIQNGAWMKSVLAVMPPPARDRLMTFMRMLETVLIRREIPSRSCAKELDWVWAAESVAKHGGCYDGVLVSRSTCKLPERFTSQFLAETFNRFPPSQEVALQLVAQEALFRRLCCFCDWIVLELPRESEKATALQLVRLAMETLRRDGRREFELNLVISKYWTRDQSLEAVEELGRLHGSCGGRLVVNVFFDEMLLNRAMYLGPTHNIREGGKFRRVRWRVTMSHVATGNREEPRRQPNRWSIDATSTKRGDPETADQLLESLPVLRQFVY